jgi:hypothetical protein
LLLRRAAFVIGQLLELVDDLLLVWIHNVLLCFTKIFSCEITFGQDGAYLALASIVQIFVFRRC